jgi:O-acetyl-ADP-ribose deacetylase (regulator of RNase III)
MISIEAYRAAIGRFHCKTVKKDRSQMMTSSEINLLLLITILSLLIYGLFIVFSCTDFFMYFLLLLIVILTHGYVLLIISISSDLLAMSFEKHAIKERLFRKTSLANGVKAHQALIHCKYLDTIVLDGRDGKPGSHKTTMNIDLKNQKIYHSTINQGYEINCEKIWTSMINAGYYIVLFGVLFLSIKFMLALFVMGNNDNQWRGTLNHSRSTTNDLELYSLNHLKLSQLLIDGDVESNPGPVDNNMVTPKSKGRPKKTSKKGALNFMKGKKLDFTHAESGNINPNLDTNQSVNVINHNFMNKISVVQSDICNVKCEAIVNAAKHSLLGGGGIDGHIHSKAGITLQHKCRDLPIKGKDNNGDDIRCYTGECKVTDTIKTNLEKRFKYVFHTVGPDCRIENDMILNAKNLKNCYESILENVLSLGVKSIAICCISTGIYEYPRKEAAEIAFESVTKFLETYHQSVEKIIFCTFYKEDFDKYMKLKNGNNPRGTNIVNNTRNEPSSSINVDPVTNTTTAYENNLVNNLPATEIINIAEKVPVPLRNTENVCFFNSVVQVLFSLIPFRERIFSDLVDNHVIRNMKQLFRRMESVPTNNIPTYPTVTAINIPHYRNFEQMH